MRLVESRKIYDAHSGVESIVLCVVVLCICYLSNYLLFCRPRKPIWCELISSSLYLLSLTTKTGPHGRQVMAKYILRLRLAPADKQFNLEMVNDGICIPSESSPARIIRMCSIIQDTEIPGYLYSISPTD
jgi:hypothetical protein